MLDNCKFAQYLIDNLDFESVRGRGLREKMESGSFDPGTWNIFEIVGVPVRLGANGHGKSREEHPGQSSLGGDSRAGRVTTELREDGLSRIGSKEATVDDSGSTGTDAEAEEKSPDWGSEEKESAEPGRVEEKEGDSDGQNDKSGTDERAKEKDIGEGQREEERAEEEPGEERGQDTKSEIPKTEEAERGENKCEEPRREKPVKTMPDIKTETSQIIDKVARREQTREGENDPERIRVEEHLRGLSQEKGPHKKSSSGRTRVRKKPSQKRKKGKKAQKQKICQKATRRAKSKTKSRASKSKIIKVYHNESKKLFLSRLGTNNQRSIVIKNLIKVHLETGNSSKHCRSETGQSRRAKSSR